VGSSKTPCAARSPPGAWQIRFVASGGAALLYASAQGKYDRVRLRMRQVEAFAKSTTKLVMQRHSNMPGTQPHNHAPQRQSLCANGLQGSFLMPRSPVANARIPSSSCQPSFISHQGHDWIAIMGIQPPPLHAQRHRGRSRKTSHAASQLAESLQERWVALNPG
jgi:hypothetical protein